MKIVRRGLLLALVLGASVLAVLSLRPRPASVDIGSVSVGRLETIVQESGMTRVKDRFIVSAPVSGTLSRLAFEPGDEVKEGDPLAEIAPALSPLLDNRTRAEAEARLGAALSAQGQANAQLARARTAKELAEQDLAREQKLAASGSSSRQSLEQSEFAARMRNDELSSALFAEKVAAEEVRVARVTLGRDRGGKSTDHHVDVLSPVSGRILRVQQKSAGVVAAGTPLVEVGDPTALEIVVDLLTTDAVQIQPGTDVRVEGWGGDEPLTGQVRRVEPSAFTRPSALGINEQRVNVIVALKSPRQKWASLGDGYRVEARLVLWRGEHVRKIPQGAVFRHGDGWAAFRVQAGVVRLAPIQIGHRGESEVELVDDPRAPALPEGAEVVVHPGDRIKDGVRVQQR
jgi:HlyD family secretion protein